MQHTTNYNLDMPEGNDQLSVMVNYNGNLQKIDAAIKGVENKADADSTEIDDLSATVSVLENDVTAVNTRLTSVEADVTTVNGKADNALAGLQEKQNTVTGAASTITSTNLTTSRALVSDASGKVNVSNVTSTELGRLSGVSSNVQAQIDNLRTHVDQIYTSTNVTAVTGTIPAFKLYKNGHIVSFDCNWVGVRPSDGNVIRLPIGYRPYDTIAINCYNSDNNEIYAATVHPDGYINLGNVGTAESVNVTFGCLFISPSTT